ncbi:hypothetical protein DRO32_02705 [Candidatus Bathyarchaeota archaeon]|nr:MAG: hypothetical protein DRO32_02705 [Candidatus Bathyarchaeota archaeon]
MEELSEEVVNKVKEMLDKMGLKYEYVEEDKVFVVPFKSGERVFNVLVALRGDWVITSALAARKEDLPEDVDEKELYKLLLRLSLELSEVTFGLTSRGDVVVHAESHVNALSFENFRIEFASVVFGVEYFAKEVAPSYPKVRVPNDLSEKIRSYIS